MKTAIVNIGEIVTGDWKDALVAGDTVLMADGLIEKVGTANAAEVESCDVVVDAGGATVCPGFIDSQVHLTFGDYTPRQKTVGFLDSYLNGGVTTSITASEVHVPGRPKDPEGVKALAVAAMKCFENFRPGGMHIYGGSVILEPGLTEGDFRELSDKGVWLAKAGFGAVETPFDYVPMIQAAKACGMITTVHTGGASIPGSAAITGEHLLAMQPHVSFHINGGPVAMPDEDFERVIVESDIALQVCTAGNLRTAIMCAELARKHDAFHRFIIATDTPTGSGIMPLGMMYMIVNLAALTDFAPEVLIGSATGSNAEIYGLNTGFIRSGRAADVLVLDAPLGGSRHTALAAMKNGDIVAIAAVFTDGIPRFVGRSRNTPPPTRSVRVVKNNVPMDFSATHG